MRSTRLRKWTYGFVVCLTTTSVALPVIAQNWMMIEARNLPQDCRDPLTCMDQSNLILRNMMAVSAKERQTLLQILNSMSAIRGIPESPPEDVALSDVIPKLHALEMAKKLAPLVDHPGVYFDSTALDENNETPGFSDYVRQELSRAGLRFLTEDEMMATPGRPTLTVRYSAYRESAGCIIPFSVSVSINEEFVQVRNPSLKKKTAVWSALGKQNLANTHYTPLNSLKEAVQKLAKDYRAANPPA